MPSVLRQGMPTFLRAARVNRASVAALALTALAILLMGGFYAQRKWRAAERIYCQQNLLRIGRAMEAYWQISDRHWPWMSKLPSSDIHDPAWPGMAAVLGPFAENDLSAFRCPSDRRRLAESDPLRGTYPAATTWFETEGTSYEWLLADVYAGKPVGREAAGGRRAIGGGPADQPIMWDFEPFHGGRGTPGSLNILYADLKVRSDESQVSRERP